MAACSRHAGMRPYISGQARAAEPPHPHRTHSLPSPATNPLPHSPTSSGYPAQVLMRAGDAAGRFYVVLRGQLQVTVADEFDGEVLGDEASEVVTLGPGDELGELGLLDESALRTADVSAAAASISPLVLRRRPSLAPSPPPSPPTTPLPAAATNR